MDVDQWLLDMKLRIRKQVKREFNEYVEYFRDRDSKRVEYKKKVNICKI